MSAILCTLKKIKEDLNFLSPINLYAISQSLQAPSKVHFQTYCTLILGQPLFIYHSITQYLSYDSKSYHFLKYVLNLCFYLRNFSNSVRVTSNSCKLCFCLISHLGQSLVLFLLHLFLDLGNPSLSLVSPH